MMYVGVRMCECRFVYVCANDYIGGVNVLLPYAVMSVVKHLRHLIWYCVKPEVQP